MSTTGFALADSRRGECLDEGFRCAAHKRCEEDGISMRVKLEKDELYPYYRVVAGSGSYSFEADLDTSMLGRYENARKKFEKAADELNKALAEQGIYH